jgi:hypothetical protein
LNQLAIISTVILCFVIYTIIPLLIPIFFLSFSSASTTNIVTLPIWGFIFLTQLVCLYQIIKRNKKWLHVFFFLLFISILLSISDYIILITEGTESELDFTKIIDDLLFPLFAMWVVYFSDANDFFNLTNESNNE